MPDDFRIPMTPEGKARLEAELKKWKEERPVVIKAIGEARAQGDLSENAEYHAARERQGILEANVRKLEDVLGRAEIIQYHAFTGPKIRFGATVTLWDEEKDETVTWQLVGDPEADRDQHRISILAPLGRALIGKEEGDTVEFRAPGGVRRLEVTEVKYV
jgi:transcription elongation factor GreA